MAKIKLKTKDGKHLEKAVPTDEILFNALEDAGVELRHGCLSGSCGTCKINVTENPENLSEPNAIEIDTLKSIDGTLRNVMPEDEVDKLNIRLACRAKVKGDVSFEAFQTPKKK